MTEHPHTFGPRGHLVGTVCQPTAAAASVGFILLNAGVIHRVGPRRFNVKLARELARKGFASLRFDVSGLGDSATAGGAASYEAQVRDDLRAAMDTLAKVAGIDRVVIAGICSGAQAALNVAPHDERVAGLWMLDGPAYPTLKSRLVRIAGELQRAPGKTLRRWLIRALRMRHAEDKPAFSSQAAATPEGAQSRQDYARTLEALHRRGVQMYLMYSSDRLWQYSYEGQFRDTFAGHRFAEGVRCERLPEADHTLTALAVQHDVMARICQWAVQHWRPSGSTAAGRPSGSAPALKSPGGRPEPAAPCGA